MCRGGPLELCGRGSAVWVAEPRLIREESSSLFLNEILSSFLVGSENAGKATFLMAQSDISHGALKRSPNGPLKLYWPCFSGK